MLAIVERAAAVVGGVSKLALAIGVSRQWMYEWSEVPAHLAIPMERAQRAAVRAMRDGVAARSKRIVTRCDIRPDLYRRKPKKRK